MRTTGTNPPKANFVKHAPCPDCGSKDNMAVYDDNSTYCFGCAKRGKDVDGSNTGTNPSSGDKRSNALPDVGGLHDTNIPDRGVSRTVCQFFGVKTEVVDGQIASHYYPYTRDGNVVAYKQRLLPKSFRVHGSFDNVALFGQSLFASGGNRVIITEGELDALAVAEAHIDKYNKIYPVVSMPSASGKSALLAARDWLRTFKEIIWFGDVDEAGEKALKDAANILGIDKLKIVDSGEKDASDVLNKRGKRAVLEAIWNAQPYSPAGIVTGEAIWDEITAYQSVESVPYPDCLEGLNHKLKGMRHGEITLFTSGTGSGKSTVIKEIILDLYGKTEDKIGIVSLEEGVADTSINLIAMHLGRSRHEGDGISEVDLRTGFDALFADSRLVLLDHQGAVSDESLMDKIRYMAAMGCKYIILDHITIAVSEGADGLTGNEAIDKTMSDLLKVCKQYGVWLGVISHLRKTGVGGKSFEEGHLASLDDIKGSGSIKQISFDIVAFARNLIAESEEERNTIKLRVLKSRYTGLTGDAGAATYNNKTGRLSYVSNDLLSFDVEL